MSFITPHRILVFIPTTNEQQRFVPTGAFDPLGTEFDLRFVLPVATADRMIAESDGRLTAENTVRLDLDPARFEVWRDLFAADCVKYGHLSTSFRLRSGIARLDRGHRAMHALDERALRTLERVLPSMSRVQRLRRWRKRLRKSIERELKYRSVAALGESAHYDDVLARMEEMGPSEAILELLREQEPLLSIVPTSLLDPVCNELAWAGEKSGTPVVVLQSGWDNLSSKGRIAFPGCWMGVWGSQSAHHAKEVQGVASKRILDLGAPHYEQLGPVTMQERAAMRASLGAADHERILLFGGSFRPFDETSQLKVLETAIADGVLPPTRVVYRPHPWRADRKDEDSFLDHQWRHVVLDPDMAPRYEWSKAEPGSMKTSNPLFAMDYLRRMLGTCDAVISPMSTLLIESLLMRRPTLALAFSDGKHAYSPDITSQMTHFQDIKDVPSLLWCIRAKKLVKMTARLFDDAAGSPGSDKSLDQSQKKIAQVVVRAPRTYGERLRHEILERVDHQARHAFHKRRTAQRRTMNEVYGIDHIARRHCGFDDDSLAIPGYWAHGWHPEFHAVHPSMLAVHKRMSGEGGSTDLPRLISEEKRTSWQWVAREDQAEFLRSHGYRHVEAIGLPAVYAQIPRVPRVPGSLLVMPPHGHRCHGPGDPLADAYAEKVAGIADRFSEVVVCVSDGDYGDNQWVRQFRERGIRVITGAVSTRPNTLAEILGLLSRFEFVTTNGFGSHIAYAAWMGARGSIWGPFAEFPYDRMKSTHRAKADSALHEVGYRLHAEPAVREHLGAFFVDPWDGLERQEWGSRQIGEDRRRTPAELAALFGWTSPSDPSPEPAPVSLEAEAGGPAR